MLTHARGSEGLGTVSFCHARGSKGLGTVRFPTNGVGRSTWNCQVFHTSCVKMGYDCQVLPKIGGFDELKLSCFGEIDG